MLDTLTKILHSMTKSIEILYVLEGVKNVSRIIVNEPQVEKLTDYLSSFKLNLSISDFKIRKEVDELRQYSDKGFKIDKNSSESGQVMLYVSRNKEYSENAKSYEARNEHFSLGEILGYPKCCINFFIKNFPIESKKKNDYVLASLRNSDGFKFPFYNNTAIRHLDLTLLSHFPCRFNCSASLEIAKRNLKLIRILSVDLVRIFEDFLKSAVIYSSDLGVFVLRGIKVNENDVHYNDVLGTANNWLYKLIRENHRIIIRDKNYFIIGNIEIKGEDFGVMVFYDTNISNQESL